MIKILSLILTLVMISFSSFSGVETIGPYFKFNKGKDGNKITLEGEISLLTIEKFTKFLKQEYYKHSKDPKNRGQFKELAEKIDVKKIVYLINSNQGITNRDKNRIKEIFKYILRLNITDLEVNSPGGHLIQIFPLGLLVRELGISINIKEGGICASACAYLFHQATIRSMGENSQLMYHLGIIQQGKDIFNIKTCHAFNMKSCNLSLGLEFILMDYRDFINDLPTVIHLDVLDEKDRFVSKEEAYHLKIIK